MSVLPIGNLPIGPSGAGTNSFSTEHQQAPYKYWRARTIYRYRSGLQQRGVTAPSSSGGAKVAAAITQSHAPIMEKIVEFAGARQGAVPAIPSPSTTNPNEAFADYELILSSPDLMADGGQRIYEISGTYQYLLSTYLAPSDGQFNFPAPPFDSIATPMAVPQERFKTTIVG
jgi:hypothetical protein